MSRARCYAAEGFAVVAIDAPNYGDRPRDGEFGRIAAEMRAGVAAGRNPGALVAGMYSYLASQAVVDWQAVLTAVQRLGHVGVGPVGYCGMSMVCGLGIPLIAAEPRVRVAVLGLLGVRGLTEDAARITVPVQFLVQWGDQLVLRDQCLALFGALASAEKTLHANPGRHGDVPSFEVDSSLRFFARHLSWHERTVPGALAGSRSRPARSVRTVRLGPGG
ncbi:alpha/beta hydrolase [Streptomyces sp. NPDC020794]|uniref:alpha/beta hydrolase n=1 Tax=unclassified Streptomyces TaxID=2593676 RepID=UPI0036EAE12F